MAVSSSVGRPSHRWTSTCRDPSAAVCLLCRPRLSFYCDIISFTVTSSARAHSETRASTRDQVTRETLVLEVEDGLSSAPVTPQGIKQQEKQKERKARHACRGQTHTARVSA